MTSDRLAGILSAGVLRVGTTMDTPAFSMRDRESGRCYGFDVDALESLGLALGVKIELIKMTFGSMLDDLSADRFDIAMSGMGRTLERARKATFSRPYMVYGKLLTIRANDAGRWNKLADIDKPELKIAFNRGGLNDHFANTMFRLAAPTGYESNDAATHDLLAGRVDAQVSDSTAALYRAKTDPRFAVLDPDTVFNPMHVAILIGRHDQTLLNFIDIWIDHIELDGTLGQLKAKWLS